MCREVAWGLWSDVPRERRAFSTGRRLFLYRTRGLSLITALPCLRAARKDCGAETTIEPQEE